MPTLRGRRVRGGDPEAGTRAWRENLVFGEYIVNEVNSGLLPGWTYADLDPYPTGGATYVTLAPGTYSNRIFWCEVRIPNNGTGPVILDNCALAGQDPETIASVVKTHNGDSVTRTYLYGADNQTIRCYDSNIYQWQMIDGEINPGLWWNAAANPPGGARTGNMVWKLRSSLGVRGGSGTLHRVRFRNQQDHVSINFPSVAGTGLSDPSFLHVKGCDFGETLFFISGDPTLHWQAEGTHSDDIQFHRGKNIEIIGNRLVVGSNAGFMIQQEVSGAIDDLIVNVEIAHNLIDFSQVDEVDGYGFNHSTKYVNDFSTTSVHDNMFLPQPDGLSRDMIVRIAYVSRYTNNRRVVWDAVDTSVTDIGAAVIVNGG